jgi:DNA polymerase III subunit epsilon
VVSSAVMFLNEQLGLRQCTGPLRPGQAACALLEMKKCLGPCVGAVSNAEYAAAVDRGLKVLQGQDTSVLERAAQRRDDLGEQLRFEEAAELRDRIRDLEQVIGSQQRLAAFSDRNVVLVTPDRQADRMRLLLIRAGRLVDEVSLPARATPSHLRHLLRRAYAGSSKPQVSRDELDDLLILDAWSRRHSEEVTEVAIEVSDLEAAIPALRAAMTPVAVGAQTVVGAA